MTDYYQLELDDMVIALENKDVEIENLQKKLDIATKALEEYAKDYFYTKGGGRYENHNPMLAQQALKDMEEV